MTIEKEANYIAEKSANFAGYDPDAGIRVSFVEYVGHLVFKALQKKQHRINELETLLSGKTGFCLECETKAKRLDELESALKRLYEFVESPVAKLTAESLNEFIEAKESAKKALGCTQGAELVKKLINIVNKVDSVYE